MHFLTFILELLKACTLTQAFFIFLIENILVWGMAIIFGWSLVKLFPHRRTTVNSAHTFSTNLPLELSLSMVTVLTNTLITLAGFYLWKANIIVVKPFEGGWLDIADALLLVLIIDLAMYLLHRVAHIRPFYSILHTLHHKFEEPTSLTLFSLHPLENLSFGVLWLTILSFYPASIVGIILYLTFNVSFGVIGHCGVDPFPKWWNQHPVLKYVATGSFHVAHHRNEKGNFGFYTTLWDRLLGTYKPQD